MQLYFMCLNIYIYIYILSYMRQCSYYSNKTKSDFIMLRCHIWTGNIPILWTAIKLSTLESNFIRKIMLLLTIIKKAVKFILLQEMKE